MQMWTWAFTAISMGSRAETTNLTLGQNTRGTQIGSTEFLKMYKKPWNLGNLILIVNCTKEGTVQRES